MVNPFHLLIYLWLFFIVGCVPHGADKQPSPTSNSINIELPAGIDQNLPFVSRYYGEGDWQATLAMNVYYPPVKEIKQQIEQSLYQGKKLRHFLGWNPQGEAHITVITPVEYQQCMWSKKRKLDVLHINTINNIATSMRIQSADIQVLGLGVGRKTFSDRGDTIDQTHYLVVSSTKLIDIRKAIYARYLKAGGNADCWSPLLFFPHVTIGYTYQDIHYPDVKKDLQHSADLRFSLTQSHWQ